MKKYRKDLNKKQYKAMLDDLCSDQCPPEKHCVLKDFLVSGHTSPRMLMQLKCVDKYKSVFAKEKGIDADSIDWNEALTAWSERGLALKFNDIYDEECLFRDLYNALISG